MRQVDIDAVDEVVQLAVKYHDSPATKGATCTTMDHDALADCEAGCDTSFKIIRVAEMLAYYVRKLEQD